MSRRLVALLAVSAALAAAPATAPPASAQEPALTERLQERIRLRVEEPPGPAARDGDVLRVDGSRIQAAGALRRFYGERVHLPAWIGPDGRVLRRARGVLAGLRAARRHGLPPEDYHAARIESLLGDLEGTAGRAAVSGIGGEPEGDRRPGLLTRLDLLLTDAFLTYGSHLASGRVDPRSIDPLWTVSGREVDLAEILRRTLEQGRSPEAALRDLAPRQPGYARLRESLAAHRRVAATGGWPAVPEGPTLRAGDSGPRVAALRKRLAASGDLADSRRSGARDTAFGEELDAAVRAFQRRHGLEPDGVVGEGTLGALGVPAERRARQIELNLERWRWLPDEFGDRHLRVNIADFGLTVVEGDSVALSMRAVVGRDYRQTPVFSDTMRYVVLSPSWTVPRSIAARDILPRLRESVSYLEEQGMAVYGGWRADAPRVDPTTVDWSRLSPDSLSYRFVQRPGPLNALGRVKFMFPNQFSVYIHDSPARSLFDRNVRSFSSGCIRVERPRELLDYVFRGSQQWTPTALRGALETGREQTIRLPRELPVHIEYWTAWVGEEDGAIHFRPDIYGRDSRLAGALAAEPPADH